MEVLSKDPQIIQVNSGGATPGRTNPGVTSTSSPTASLAKATPDIAALSVQSEGSKNSSTPLEVSATGGKLQRLRLTVAASLEII